MTLNDWFEKNGFFYEEDGRYRPRGFYNTTYALMAVFARRFEGIHIVGYGAPSSFIEVRVSMINELSQDKIEELNRALVMLILEK